MSDDKGIPVGIIGGAAKVAGLILSIYNAKKTDQFRTVVKHELDTLANGIRELHGALAKIDAELNYWHALDGGNPFAVIQGYMEKAEDELNGPSPDSPAKIPNLASDVDKAMLGLRTALEGTVPNEKQLLRTFLDKIIQEKTSHTSDVEVAYSYFNRAIKSLIQGYWLLAYYQSDLIISWNTYFSKENGLKKLGQSCQKVVNSYGVNALDWRGNDDTHMWSYETAYVWTNNEFNLANDEVITGFDFVEDKKAPGVLAINIWFGNIGADGYVRNVGVQTKRGGDKVQCQTITGIRKSSTGYWFNAYALIATDSVQIPEGNAIVDVRWVSICGKTVIPVIPEVTVEENPNIPWTYIYLSVKHTPIETGGKVDSKKAVWTPNPADTNQIKPRATIREERAIYDLSLPRGIAFNTGQWTHWNPYSREAAVPPEWNTPLTGARQYKGKAANRWTYHHKMFSPAS